jgi:hypothetical protein
MRDVVRDCQHERAREANRATVACEERQISVCDFHLVGNLARRASRRNASKGGAVLPSGGLDRPAGAHEPRLADRVVGRVVLDVQHEGAGTTTGQSVGLRRRGTA